MLYIRTMSGYKIKTTYNETGSYGSTDVKILYFHQNNSCDIGCFYDENGNVLFCVEDTVDNNLMDAITRLWKSPSPGFSEKLPEDVAVVYADEWSQKIK